jgi:hypothetical protein
MAEIGHISHHDATDVMANSILPNVKVTKIILNGGASANVSEFETDPHVDGVHGGGGVSTAMEQDQTSDTPQDTLSVSVDVEMFELEENMLNNALLFDTSFKNPDVFGFGSGQNTPMGDWFGEGDTLIPALANYVKIRIMLLDTAETLTGVNAVTQEHIGALDPVLYHEILVDADTQHKTALALAMINNPHNPDSWPKIEDFLNFDSDPSYVLRQLTTEMAEALKSTVPEMDGDHRVKDLSIKNDSVLGSLSIDDLELSFGQAIQNQMFHITKNKNGKKVVHIPYRHTFNTKIPVKNGKPETKNLAVVAYSYIDIEAMMNDSAVVSATEGTYEEKEMMISFGIDDDGQPIPGTEEYGTVEVFTPDTVAPTESVKELYGMKDFSPHLMGTPWSEIVYYKGDQRTKRKVFFTSDGKLYNGNVQYDPQTATFKVAGGYLNNHVFTEHPDQGQALSFQEATNAVVQNNLVLKRLDSWASTIDLEESFLQQSESLKGTSVAPSGDITPYGNGVTDPSNSKRPSYFSEAYITKDANGHVRFLFSLDFKKLLMHNSPFPFMYNTSESFMQWGTIEELLKLGHIKTIKIVRQRVKPEMVRTGKDPLAKNGYDQFNDVTPTIILETANVHFNSGASTLSEITLNTSTFASQILDAEILASDGVEISTSAGSLNSLRHFVVTDKTITPQMVGKYQYGVEITVREAAREYLNLQLEKLIWAKRNLENYYLQANSFYHDPTGGINSKRPYFDNIYQKFIPEFWERIKLLYGDPADGAAMNQMPYYRPSDLYVEVLTILTRKGFFDSMAMMADLRNLCDPVLGSPTGILMVMRLIDNLISYMSSKLGSTKKGRVGSFEKVAQSGEHGNSAYHASQGTTVPQGFFKHTNFFNECIDLTEHPDCYYDYLSTFEGDNLPPITTNLRIFTKEKWAQRGLYEDYKYFEKTGADSNLNISMQEKNPFGPGATPDQMLYGMPGLRYTMGDTLARSRSSFLGPSKINLINQPFLRMVNGGFLTNNIYYDYQKYYNMFCDIINFNLNKNTTYTAAMFSADFGKTSKGFGDYIDLDIIEIKKDSYGVNGKLSRLYTRQKLNEIFNYHYSLIVQDPAYLSSLQTVNDGAKYLIDNPDDAAEQIQQMKDNAAEMATILDNPNLENAHAGAAAIKEIFDDMIENAEILVKGETDGLSYGKSYPPPRQDRGLDTVGPLLSLLRLLMRGEQYYTFNSLSADFFENEGKELHAIPETTVPWYSMNNYNLLKENNLFKRYMLMKAYLDAETEYQKTGAIDPLTGGHVQFGLEEIGMIPNSIKSLFLQGTYGLEKEALRKNYLVEGYNLTTPDGGVSPEITNPEQEVYQQESMFPFMLFNYHMTQRVEYLEAYSQENTAKSISDDFSVKGPVWKMLTQDIIDNPPGGDNGKYLFCRLVPHKYNMAAIDYDYAVGKELKLPIIDQYFLIDISSPSPLPPPMIDPLDLPESMAVIMDDTLNANKQQVMSKMIAKPISGIDNDRSAVITVQPRGDGTMAGLPEMGDRKRMSRQRGGPRAESGQRGGAGYGNIPGGMASEPGPGPNYMQEKLSKSWKRGLPPAGSTKAVGKPKFPKSPGKG